MNDEGLSSRSLHSPDGRLQVRLHRHVDERSGPWETVVITDTTRPGFALELPAGGTCEEISFGAAGQVLLALGNRSRYPQRVRIDLSDDTFVFHPTDEGEPLMLLPARLNERMNATAAPILPSAADRASARRNAWLGLLSSLALAGAGLWMALDAAGVAQRWIGIAGCGFFAAGAFVYGLDLRSEPHRTKPPPT